MGALGGSLLVFAAGLVDDLAQTGPRGLRAHLRSLASGRMTTGIVKVVVIAGSAAVVVALQPDRPGYAAVCGVVLLAACANAWNGLDVAPGRSLKAFLLPAIAFVVWGEVANAALLPGLLVGAVVSSRSTCASTRCWGTEGPICSASAPASPCTTCCPIRGSRSRPGWPWR